jgi:tetratricopeptide (TPR) repeat protein
MRISSLPRNTDHLNINEAALIRCQTALELKDRGDYRGAKEAMGLIWSGPCEQPNLKGLHASVAAEVNISVGILTSWAGSKEGLESAQEVAKNLISEGISFYESLGDSTKVAAAQAEIAYCYFREGAFEEARIMLKAAIAKLTTEGNTRARALLKLATVEWADSRFSDALQILNDNANLFQKLTNHTLQGNYHNELAVVLRHLAKADVARREALLQKAVVEFGKADHHFQLAKNNVFRSSVKNNVALILLNLSKFKEAHKYLDQARRLAATIRNKVQTSEIDESRAQVFIAERKFKEAEAVARNAVRNLEKTGHQCLLADALITHGIALARLKRAEPARFAFQRAIEIAHQVGVLNKAGIAALTMIEELEDLTSDALYAAYDRASDWLATSNNHDLLIRLNAIGRKVIIKVRSVSNLHEATPEDPIEAIFNKPCDLQREVLKFEGSVIQRALAKANGSLTRAAALLSMSYQALAYILESRQPDLLKERTPIRRRSRRDTATAAPAEAEQA